ncbi:hypothetical protein F0562_000517 [Nyssa sinensis]|uniref:Uncharacterized protein n=1 Tax=Nyssa sinensis TaxID=561372 RepID=A0A5J5C097_9ASTE|nr:hypothetical protein F0562_000517 [Nyssa sinensis]
MIQNIAENVTTIDEEMEMLGKKMVQRCPGLPLAIILLGGLLATKQSSKEWERVYQNIDWYKSRLEYSRLQEVIDFSYRDLPYRLKQCYLFLGNFPENSEIKAKKLYHLWIAEGIISKTGLAEGETMMAKAEHYLGELAQRGIVQVRLKKYCHTKRFKSCQLHNKMRGLCLSNVKRENFLEVIDFRHGNIPAASSSSYSSSKIRRLAIYLDNEINKPLPRAKENCTHLRSVLFFHSYFGSYWKKMVKFSDFNLLRILDLEGFDFVEEELPKEIGNLTSLRYMSLRDCKIKTLPSFIGNLRYLQILDLRVKHVDHLYVPNVLLEMEDLRHLYLPTSLNSELNDLQLNGLSNLETLVNFDCCVCHVKDLSRLSNLRMLKAIISGNPNAIGGLLKEITQQNLCFSLAIYNCSFSSDENTLLGELLGCRHLYKLEMRGKISGLLENFQSCTSLTKLTLSYSELEHDPMPILEKLSLRRLILSIESFSGTDMVCSTGGFSQLESLVLKGLRNLENWEVREKAMPKLSHLRISGSENLTMIPDGLRYVTTLQELEIFWMPQAFVNRLRDNLDKVSGVPVIKFHNTIIDSQVCCTSSLSYYIY